MSNIIQVLEELGRLPAGREPWAASYGEKIGLTQCDERERRAIIEQDHQELNDILGGRRSMVFAIWAPDDVGGGEDGQEGEQVVVETGSALRRERA